MQGIVIVEKYPLINAKHAQVDLPSPPLAEKLFMSTNSCLKCAFVQSE